jgi:hypothetical protein
MVLAVECCVREKDPLVAEEVNFLKISFASMAVFDTTVGLMLEARCVTPGRAVAGDMVCAVGSVPRVCVSQFAGGVLVDEGEVLVDEREVLVDVGEDLVGGLAGEPIVGELHEAVGVTGKETLVGRDQVDGTGQMVAVVQLLGAAAVVVGVVMVPDGDLVAIGAASLLVAFSLVAVACMLLVFAATLTVGWARVVVRAESTGLVWDQHNLVDHVLGVHRGFDMVLVAVAVLAARVESRVLAVAA